MGEFVDLEAADGHGFRAYRAEPAGAMRGGLVVVQEIFGVNGHIRDVADSFAAEGYAAVAPALFDRVERDIELDYDPEGAERGRALRAEIRWPDVIADVAAVVESLRPGGKVGVVGYCWGGSIAWLAACRLAVDAAVGYYGGQIMPFVDETPKCPILLHFGEIDSSIPLADVERIRAAHPDIPVHVYPGADHGFNCDRRGSYHPESAALARTRTLDMLRRDLG